MTNHPGRKPGSVSAPLRMTPSQLRDLLQRTGLTQAQAAELCNTPLRAFQRWLADEGTESARAMPRSASGLLCLSIAVLRPGAGLLGPWLPPPVAEKLGVPYRPD